MGVEAAMSHMGPGCVETIFGDRDEILIREVDLRRNNDSPTSPSEFNCCAEGLGVRVFTQPGPVADFRRFGGMSVWITLLEK